MLIENIDISRHVDLSFRGLFAAVGHSGLNHRWAPEDFLIVHSSLGETPPPWVLGRSTTIHIGLGSGGKSRHTRRVCDLIGPNKLV